MDVMSSARALGRRLHLFASCNAMGSKRHPRRFEREAHRWLEPLRQKAANSGRGDRSPVESVDQSGARTRGRARATKFRIAAERLSLRTARLVGARGASPFIGT
jgi:hypothetical protein